MHDPRRSGVELLLAALLALAPAAAEDLPRVGLGGCLRMGLAGVLLRAGQPCVVLGDREQCDLSVLRQYDVLYWASMQKRGEPWIGDANRALDTWIREGGRAVCEGSSRAPEALKGLHPKFIHGAGGAEPDRGFRLARLDHPLLRRLPRGEFYPYAGGVTRIDEDPEGTVLARFTEGPAEGRPAILVRRYGQGEVVYLAANLCYTQGNWLNHFDDLLLAILGYLTDGRVRRQWSPATDVPEPPPAAEPALPVAVAPPPAGWTDLGEACPTGYAVACGTVTAGEWRLDEVAVVVADGRVTARAGDRRATAALGARPLRLLRLPDRLDLVVGAQRAASLDLAAPRGRVLQRTGAPVEVQPLEPLFISDDFTRDRELGWQRVGGRAWLTGTGEPFVRVPEFALRLRRGAVATGSWFWADYRAEVAVQPRTARAVRLQVARVDARHLVELRADVAAGQLRLIHRREGRDRVVSQTKAHLPAHQWTRLSVAVVRGRAEVRVDGRVVLSAAVPEAGAGGLGFAAEGGEAVFDDLVVRDANGPAALPEVHPAGYDQGPDSKLDRDTWSHPAAAWVPTGRRGEAWHLGRFAADLSWQVPVLVQGPGRLTLHAGAERDRPAPVVALPDSLAPGVHHVAVRRAAGQWSATLDGRPLAVLGQPSGAVCLGLTWAGWELPVAAVRVAAAEVRETVFDRQPADWWETAGNWQVGSRWPCQPQYAWLTGEGAPQAAMWSKQRFTGDLVVQALLGVRMLGEYGEPGTEPFERLRITLGGNGDDPWSGYVLELGSEVPGLSRLYRRKSVVATSTLELPPWREVHNYWGDLRVERHGGTIRAWLHNRPLLSYTDPRPLGDGQVALSTERNTLVTPYLAVYGQAVRAQALPAKVEERRYWAREQARIRAGWRPELPLAALVHAIGRLFG